MHINRDSSNNAARLVEMTHMTQQVWTLFYIFLRNFLQNIFANVVHLLVNLILQTPLFLSTAEIQNKMKKKKKKALMVTPNLLQLFLLQQGNITQVY